MLLLHAKGESRNFELAQLKEKKERELMFWPFVDPLVQYFHNVFLYD